MADSLTLADAAREEGRFLDARALYSDAMTQTVSTETFEGAVILKQQATVEYALGDVGRSKLWYSTAIGIFSKLADRRGCELEIGHCWFNLAQLEQAGGRFRESERAIGEAIVHYEAASAPIDDCLVELALLCLGAAPRLEEADGLLAEVDSMRSSRAESNDQRTRRLVAHGERALVADRLREGLELLNLAAQTVGPPTKASQFLSRADVALRSAAGHRMLGEFAEAQDLIESAVSWLKSIFDIKGGRGYERRLLSAKVDRAQQVLARGDHVSAATQLRDLAGRLKGRDSELDRARALELLGNACQEQGELQSAASAHAEALAIYAGMEASPAQSSACMASLGVDHILTKKVRYVRRGMNLLAQARSITEDLPGQAAERARIQLNQAVGLALLGDTQTALKVTADAARDFSAAGLWLEQTSADHNGGVLLAELAEQCEDPDVARQLVLDACRVLIPASIVRDSVRFDLQVPEQRRRWWSQKAAAPLAVALRIAHSVGMHQIVADLIVATRTAATLGLDAHDPHQSLFSVGGLDIAAEGVMPPKRTGLRLQPGPLVMTPTAGIALGEYLAIAAERYDIQPSLLRSDSVVSLA